MVVWVCRDGEYDADTEEADGVPWPLADLSVLSER